MFLVLSIESWVNVWDCNVVAVPKFTIVIKSLFVKSEFVYTKKKESLTK